MTQQVGSVGVLVEVNKPKVTEMNLVNNVRGVFIGATIVFALMVNANANAGNPLIKEPSHSVYHVIKNKTLLEVTNQIANRSGIVFKIDASVEKDPINQKLAAENWQAAIRQLLQNYNYTTESGNNTLKTVLISGKNGSGNTLSAMQLDAELIVVKPDYAVTIPKKYKNFNAGSVLNVSLPMDQLRQIALGEEVILDLPIGQYKVKHDNLVDHGDGSSTWIGYLGDEGQGYRIYLSQGESGVMGNVFTPDGAYNIETTDGQTVIVDIDQSGLKTAGFEHDEAELSSSGSSSLIDKGLQMDDQLTDLKAAAEKARAEADRLTAIVNDLLTKQALSIEAAQKAKAQYDSLYAEKDSIKNQLTEAKSALKKSPQDDNLIADVKQLVAALNSSNKQLKAAYLVYKVAVKTKTTAQAKYNKILKLAQAAETNAKNAEALYAAKLTNPDLTSGTVGSTDNVVVDLMVLYTTVNQTAAYAKQRIQYLVDLSNQAYKDSGINMRLRLVHARPTDYVESNANAQALSDLTGDKGAFAGTSALRSQYGADLVVLFRPLYAQTAGSCGTAYVGFANGGNGDANSGFGTIGDGSSKDAQSNYYCGVNTFTHEIGHNLGNVHDREYSNFSGKFEYSYAWGVAGKFGTIMSYYGPSVMLFSSPALITECKGTPCGFAEGHAQSSDQAKTINHTAPIVAEYRANTVSVPVIQ